MAELSPDKKAELEARLISSRVPEHVARYTAEQSPKYRTYSLQTFIMIILMLVMFGVWLLLWSIVEGIDEARAMAAAKAAGALMYKSNFGISFIIALIGGFLVLLPLMSYLQLYSKKWRTASFAYGMGDWNSGFFLFKKPDPELEPDDYIRSFFTRMARVSLKWSSAIFTLATLVVFKEVNSYEVYDEGQIGEARLLSVSGLEMWDAEDIDYVELGCNHITGKNASDDIIYRIQMKNGSKLYMEDAEPVRGNWLDNALLIDVALEDAGVTFKRWSWLQRDPLHPECLGAQLRKLGEEDYDILLKLLRVTELAE